MDRVLRANGITCRSITQGPFHAIFSAIFLKLPNGDFTTSHRQVTEHLLQTHFPDYVVSSDQN